MAKNSDTVKVKGHKRKVVKYIDINPYKRKKKTNKKK